MKKKSNKDNPKTSTRNLVYAYLTIAALLVTATALVYWINHQQLQPSIGYYSPDEIERPVEPSLVCMVNDAYMGKPQIPVPVNGKTYYGCCQGCVDKLNNLESARIAIDPYNGNPVDKSEAYIVLLNQQGAIAYFESESNYKAFTKTQ